MQFLCDCCGKVTTIPQWGATSDADVSDDGCPPQGCRTIYTVIVDHDGDGGMTTYTSEVVHSCADCNSGMWVSEHLDAEHKQRKIMMREKAP